MLPSSQEIFKESLKYSQQTTQKDKKVLTVEVSQTQKLNPSELYENDYEPLNQQFINQVRININNDRVTQVQVSQDFAPTINSDIMDKNEISIKNESTIVSGSNNGEMVSIPIQLDSEQLQYHELREGRSS